MTACENEDFALSFLFCLHLLYTALEKNYWTTNIFIASCYLLGVRESDQYLVLNRRAALRGVIDAVFTDVVLNMQLYRSPD